MIEKTMYQLSYCEVWDDYWYSGHIYETEEDASAAGKNLDQKEYMWAIDPVVVHLRSNLFKFTSIEESLPPHRS